MNSIADCFERLAAQWSTPRVPSGQMADSKENQVALKCEVRRRITPIAIQGKFPSDLVEMWSTFEDAVLFADSRQTMWGLHLLSREASEVATQAFRSETYAQFQSGDVIIGEFFGDLDRLLVRCDPDLSDYGHVIAVLPDGFRREWFHVASSLSGFLEIYEKKEGEKYWERSTQT